MSNKFYSQGIMLLRFSSSIGYLIIKFLPIIMSLLSIETRMNVITYEPVLHPGCIPYTQGD